MRANDVEIDINKIKLELYYEESSGKLFRKPREGTTLKDRQFNGRFGDKEAGTLRKDGYVRVKVCGRYLLAHRVIWAIMYDRWPTEIIDHKDRDRSNNRLSNLREATKSENCTNSLRKDGKHKGIRFDKRRGTFHVRLTKDGKTKYLGQAQTLEMAIDIYRKFSYSVHGEFTLESEVSNGYL